jgi:UDP-N-acetylglucosamine 1-carboxyvinyltransferase
MIDGHDDPLHATVRVTSDRTLRPTTITTQPHPGFPTDLQAQFMTLLCLAEGNSIITEKIYPERFGHVAELSRMGAKIYRQGPTCVVSGGTPFRGAQVMASDLRASASLVLAGLAAEGVTEVSRIYHLDRGYTRMEEQLNVLGARIERVREDARIETKPELKVDIKPEATIETRSEIEGENRAKVATDAATSAGATPVAARLEP